MRARNARTAFSISVTSRGGADAAAAAAAALTSSYMAFRGSDQAFALRCLQHAQQLYALATALPAKSVCEAVACYEGLPGGGYAWKAFPSTSVYDDLALAAAWLHVATGARVACAGAARAFACT